jgi:hypothetical protein
LLPKSADGACDRTYFRKTRLWRAAWYATLFMLLGEDVGERQITLAISPKGQWRTIRRDDRRPDDEMRTAPAIKRPSRRDQDDTFIHPTGVTTTRELRRASYQRNCCRRSRSNRKRSDKRARAVSILLTCDVAVLSYRAEPICSGSQRNTIAMTSGSLLRAQCPASAMR